MVGSVDDWDLGDYAGQADRWSRYGSGLTVAMPVDIGVRWLSLLPMPNGNVMAVDCTPSCNVMYLGHLIPMDRAYIGPRDAQRYRGIDHAQHDLGTGTWAELLHRAFRCHILCPTALTVGVDDPPPEAPRYPAWDAVLDAEGRER